MNRIDKLIKISGTYRYCAEHGRRRHPANAKDEHRYYHRGYFRCGKFLGPNDQDVMETCAIKAFKGPSGR